jgi:hypothetical protein
VVEVEEEEIQEVDNEEEIQAVPNQEAQVIDVANEAPEAALAMPEPPTEKVENEPQPGPSNETDENKTKTAKKRSGTINLWLLYLELIVLCVLQHLRWKVKMMMINCVRSALTLGKAQALIELCPSSVDTCLAEAVLRNGLKRTKSVPSVIRLAEW